MRKNSPRKWLHACLDLLPVILIPVFMIYSHRHDISGGSVEVPQYTEIDFNQLIPNKTLSSISPFVVDFNTETYVLDISGSYETETSYSLATYNDLPIALTTKFYVRQPTFVSSDTENKNFYYRFYSHDYVSGNYFRDVSLTQGNGGIVYTISGFNSIYGISMIKWSNVNEFYYEVPLQIFNLTQMFGSGNEPTASEFESMFPRSDYEYTLSHKQLVQTNTILYDDTDIMSQFTYQLYNSVDKYFNMGNVFNMNGVYDWFNLNIFHGSAPIYIYVVWQIVLYEFVMDLLFLLYGLFMWFIDMVQHLMDKPFKSIK